MILFLCDRRSFYFLWISITYAFLPWTSTAYSVYYYSDNNENIDENFESRNFSQGEYILQNIANKYRPRQQEPYVKSLQKGSDKLNWKSEANRGYNNNIDHKKKWRAVKRDVLTSSPLSDKARGDGILTPCDTDQLMIFLAHLQAINPESVVNLATEQDVESLCKVADSLDDVDTYLRTCEPPNQKDLYMQLVDGVRSLSKKLCVETSFYKEFMNHSVCFNQLHEEYKNCVGPSDWAENPDGEEVCKTFQELADCYYVKTALLCGKTAAQVMKALMTWVIKSVITVECDNLQQNPEVLDAMPVDEMNSNAQFSKRIMHTPSFIAISLAVTWYQLQFKN